MKYMMKCGHAANAVDKNGNPCCAICAGFTPNAFIVDEKQIDLTGRKAICSYCNTIVDSSLDLPFFLSIDPIKNMIVFMTVAGGGTDERI